jgi:anti-anti-sigma factor
VTRALPLALLHWRHRLACGNDCAFQVGTLQREQSVVLHLSGHATALHIARAIVHFRNAINLRRERMVVDLSGLDFIDTRFQGLLLMVAKQLNARGTDLQLIGASPSLEKLFRLNELGYLIAVGRGA